MNQALMNPKAKLAARDSSRVERQALPRRDWVILPLLALGTMALLAVSTELTTRRLFSETQKTLASCLVLNDPTTGPRGIPNTVCKEKNAEGGWIETRLDDRGYRNDVNLAPKSPSTFRIVMTGSSVSLGERVQREESFAALLPPRISAITGRKVELYNESMGFGFAHNTDQRFNDVLHAAPDLILWVFTPIDVESAAFTLPAVNVQQWNNQGLATKAWRRVLGNLTSKPFSAAASEILGRTRTALALRHVLYQNESEYVKSYLMLGDNNQGFLKAEPSLAWRQDLKNFDEYAADMERRSEAAGIPFAASMVPNRAQTIMIASGLWPPGYDPNKLDEEVSHIITSHGGVYLDLSQNFNTIANPGSLYLPVDGHPNVRGHAVLASLLAKALTDGSVPALDAHSTANQTEQER